MRASIKGLFVVAAMAAPAYAESPRTLRTGAPACGNVMSEEMERSKAGPDEEELALRKRCAEELAQQERALAIAKHERTHVTSRVKAAAQAKARRVAAREARRMLAPFVELPVAKRRIP
jgi:hypothetical protein